MTADQSPPAFAEMGEEIAKGWESLQEDMQRLIMDPPGTELGSRGGPEVERHSPRSLVDDGTLLPVSERPAGTTAEVQAEEPFRDIGEKMGGWFRAFAAEIAGGVRRQGRPEGARQADRPRREHGTGRRARRKRRGRPETGTDVHDDDSGQNARRKGSVERG